AVNALARQGISYRPARTAGWTFANTDACTLLTDAEIRAAGADPNTRTPGFANWSCAWGTVADVVTVSFRIDAPQLSNHGTPGVIAGHRAETRLIPGLKQCDVLVVTRPARSLTDHTELVNAVVREPQPDQELCARASDLASAAVTRVPADVECPRVAHRVRRTRPSCTVVATSRPFRVKNRPMASPRAPEATGE
ncbi:MAG: DUF3558 family protein, partial [Pseudonocardia sp.]|nr:DUF3558 family protein [Pseudonocardia sp.]